MEHADAEVLDAVAGVEMVPAGVEMVFGGVEMVVGGMEMVFADRDQVGVALMEAVAGMGEPVVD